MGDRAMAELKTSEGSLFFYTHWSGYELPSYAKAAVEKARGRIGNDPYALRIVVDQLINAVGARDSETGAGLMLKPSAEDEYNRNSPSVIIDITTGSVETIGHDG